MVRNVPVSDGAETTVVVIGERAFGHTWNEAFGERSLFPQCFSSWADFEHCQSARRPQAGDLVIVQSSILGSSSDPSSLRRDEAGPLLVLISEFITLSNWQSIGARGLLIVPPPSNAETQRLMVGRLLELVAAAPHSKSRVCDPEVAVLTGGVSVDLSARSLFIRGNQLRLTRGEAAIMRYLLRTPGRWRATAEISLEVFQRRDPAGLNLVWKYLSTLRSKLGAHHEILRHSRTFGYQIARQDLISTTDIALGGWRRNPSPGGGLIQERTGKAEDHASNSYRHPTFPLQRTRQNRH